MAILASGLIAGMGDGMLIPLIPLALEHRGVSVMLIGVYAALPAVTLLATGPFLPRLVAAMGPLRAYGFGLALAALVLLLFPAMDDLASWFLLSLILGFAVAFQWVGADTWVNSIVTEQTRGRIVALSETAWAGAAAAGPLLLTITGIQGALPFAVGASLLALGLLPLLLGLGTVPTLARTEEWHLALRPLLVMPTAIAAAFVCGFVDTTVFALLPIYGLSLGLDLATTVPMLSVTAAGAALLQFPLGWLADRFDRRSLLLACSLVALVAAALLPFTIGRSAAVWPILFLWGGAVTGMYTISTVLVGQRFQGEELAAAITTIAMAYTLGSLLGPLMGGTLLDAYPPHGMMVALVIALALFVGTAFLRQRRNRDAY